MDSSTAQMWGAIATAATALIAVIALGITQVRSLITAATRRGAQEEREKQLRTDIAALTKTVGQNYDSVQGRIGQVEIAHNTVDKMLAVISEQVSGMRSDMGEMRAAVSEIGKSLDQTLREVLGKPARPPRSVPKAV